MTDKTDKKVEKIEAFLHSEIGYQPNIDTPANEGAVWTVLNGLKSVIKGKENFMGLETKVKIMWWVNYIIGFVMGFFCQAVLTKILK